MKKESYALGMSLAHNILSSGVRHLNVEAFVEAFTAVMNDQPLDMSNEEAQEVLNEYFTNLHAENVKAQKAKGEKFLEENSSKEGVVTLPSGLQYKVVKSGNGKSPKAQDQVEVHYEGRLVDGQKFDSSYDRGVPAVFGVTQVIPGWVEALQLMKEGDKWQLYIPYNLAYGEHGACEQIPPYSALVFDVELLKVK